MSPLWDACERGLVKLMYKLMPAVGLWGDTLLWLAMLGKLKSVHLVKALIVPDTR